MEEKKGVLKENILRDIELNEQTLQECVSLLRNWLQQQPHLPSDMDEDGLKAFLVGSKSVERAKHKLDKYYTARGKYTALFSQWTPSTMNYDKILKSAYLPGMTPEGWKVMFVKTLEWGTGPYDQEEAVKRMVMMVELVVREEPVCAGHIIVSDMKNVSMSMLASTSVTLTASAMHCWQNVLPIRFKGMISFHAHPVVDILINTFFKPFLSEKIKQRFHTYSGDEVEVAKHVPKDMLPEDYGGKAPSFDKLLEHWDQKIAEKESWFQEECKKTADEKKRPVDEQNTDFGIQGTFRKLTLD